MSILDEKAADLPGWQQCGFERMTNDSAGDLGDDVAIALVHHRTPHSAFRHPEVELGKPTRSRIELRATWVFV